MEIILEIKMFKFNLLLVYIFLVSCVLFEIVFNYEIIRIIYNSNEINFRIIISVYFVII